MQPETLVTIKRVIGRLARANKLELRVPLPVWDDTAQLIGVALHQDKRMGMMDCVAQATFTLGPKDYATEETIAAKANMAINALNAEILTSIKPK